MKSFTDYLCDKHGKKLNFKTVSEANVSNFLKFFFNDIQKKFWPRRNIIKNVENNTKFTSQNTNQ